MVVDTLMQEKKNLISRVHRHEAEPNHSTHTPLPPVPHPHPHRAPWPRRRLLPPALPDELVEEILLRLLPDDPACLLRASLVCKTWSGIVSHPAFRRRLHELHGAPPVLGFLHNFENQRIPHFFPTTASSFSLAAPDRRFWRAMDCRHGRALFLSKGHRDTMELIVWEPITGALLRVPVPAAAAFKSDHPTAAVFCASDGCDHRDCLGGPFRVVFVFGLCFCDDDDNDQCVTSACVYSSESGTWGELTSMHEQFGNFGDHSSVLVGRSLLYFMSYGGLILEYDLSRDSMTWLDTPCEHYPNPEQMNLMLMEEGGLGVTEVLESHLKLWSGEAPSTWGIDHDPPPRPNPTQGVGGWQGGGDEKSLEQAQQLFDKGWKALKETDFANAINCFSHTLKIRVVHYGVLAPECASTFYGYGRALLSKALKESNPPGIVSKNAPNKESAESTATTSKNAAARSSKTCSNTEHVPPLEKGDSEGKYLNERGQGDENMTSNEDSDLDLAWKMLNMARVTVAKIPDKTMEKANIFYALAEVSMKRNDRDNSLGYYIKALTIFEHLVRPDHLGIVHLNFRICLAFELASKVGDAIPYCAKAILVCKSRIQNLKNAMEEGRGDAQEVSLQKMRYLPLLDYWPDYRISLKNWSKQRQPKRRHR
ncbi:hypothetical protein ZWY2020_018944 [Hordeum vulgare]|nr:hypothetical protein ZWY2020_018944 [Hordeum vulgare]